MTTTGMPASVSRSMCVSSLCGEMMTPAACSARARSTYSASLRSSSSALHSTTE
jgi:hypothetical protein